MKTKGYEFAKRIKFSLKKDDLENRIKDLNYATVILRDVRNTCISRTELTLESTSPTITKFTAALNIVRDNAHRLYSAIACAYAGCHPEHATRLFLQSRSTLMRKSRSLRKDPGAFTMAFPHNEAAPSPDPKPDALSCYKIDIKILDEELETCDLKYEPQTNQCQSIAYTYAYTYAFKASQNADSHHNRARCLKDEAPTERPKRYLRFDQASKGCPPLTRPLFIQKGLSLLPQEIGGSTYSRRTPA